MTPTQRSQWTRTQASTAAPPCACGKPAGHLHADPDSAAWACRVPQPAASRPPADPPTLLRIIDVLWSELPADVVITLAAEQPEIVDACRVIHDLVDHG